jgi:L-amino acid N-acyltransferase YncA
MNDLAEAQPWWNRRIENQSFLRDPQALPEIGVDPDDEDAEQRLRRRHDLGSLTHAENRRALELDRKETKLAKQKKADAKHQRLAAMADNLDHLRISTGVKLFVRAARKEDMEAIANIYNFYILNTTSTPEIDPRTKDQMQQRWKDTRLNRMPYLVACERGGIIKARANNKKSKRNMRGGDEDIILPDVVIGFAFADDFNDLKGIYRFTAEMEVYVHTDYYMKGVGKCLLDKLMGLLDSHYLERGGYEVVGEDMDGTGQARVVKNIVVHLSYDKPEKLEWIGKWLEGWLQFRRVGVLDGIGTKNGKA